MKSFTLTLFVLLLALPLFSVVEPTNPEKAAALFELDEAEVEEAFTELDALEQYLQENPGVTLEEMQANGHELVSNLDEVNGLSVDGALADDGLGALIWVLIVLGGLALIGVCCWVILVLGAYY
jgi:hypothetical protein